MKLSKIPLRTKEFICFELRKKSIVLNFRKDINIYVSEYKNR